MSEDSPHASQTSTNHRSLDRLLDRILDRLGITENEAKASGADVKVVRFPWAASGRAQSIARTEGITKLIVDSATERVLGVGIVGPGASVPRAARVERVVVRVEKLNRLL